MSRLVRYTAADGGPCIERVSDELAAVLFAHDLADDPVIYTDHSPTNPE